MTTTLKVKIVPGASSDNIAGWLGDTLKIRVSAPPEKGKANRAVIRILSEQLDLPAHAITLTSGASNPRKTFTLDGISVEELHRRLLSP